MGMACLKKGSNICTMKNKEIKTSKWLIYGTVNCTKSVRKTKCVNSVPKCSTASNQECKFKHTLSLRSEFFWDFLKHRMVVTNVSVQLISPIFQGLCLPLEDGTYRMSQTAGN